MGIVLPYEAMPYGAPDRPLVDVYVEGFEFPVKGLVDTGATNTLMHSWVAEQADIDLTGVMERLLNVGGGTLTARFATVTMAAAGHTWEAEVGFCSEPDSIMPWALLGDRSFLRYFTATFRAADREFELEPITE